METIKRRLDLLKLEGMGFNQNEIVKELSQKYSVTERAVQYDFARRSEWQPKLLDLEKADKILQKVINRYEQIYRAASFKALTTDNDSVYIGAWALAGRMNEKIAETAVIPDLIGRLTSLEQQAKRRLRP